MARVWPGAGMTEDGFPLRWNERGDAVRAARFSGSDAKLGQVALDFLAQQMRLVS
jgi:hypothetical protein